MASELIRAPDESMDEYLIRLYSNKNVYGLSCQNIADLMNKENGLAMNEATYRKDWASFVRWNKFIEEHAPSDETLRRELLEERVRLRDERTELNRVIRDKARRDDLWQMLFDRLSQQGEKAFPPLPCNYVTDRQGSLLVCLSDLHYGMVIGSGSGYSPDIAHERMARYALDIKEVAKASGYRDCVIALLGDMISGNIHTTCRIASRENVVDQIQGVSELIAQFIYELSGSFDHIKVISVSGNHSRINSLEDSLNEERLDRLVPWYLSAKLNHLVNVEILPYTGDTTFASMEIEGQEFWFVHGDMDSFSKEAVYKLAAAKRLPPPTAVVFGHMHTNKCEFGDVGLIQGGCLSGSGDEYTTRKRLGGAPGQVVVAVNRNGIAGVVPVDLS